MVFIFQILNTNCVLGEPEHVFKLSDQIKVWMDYTILASLGKVQEAYAKKQTKIISLNYFGSW